MKTYERVCVIRVISVYLQKKYGSVDLGHLPHNMIDQGQVPAWRLHILSGTLSEAIV